MTTESTAKQGLKLSDVLFFFAGRRESIVKVASSRKVILLALLLIVSAALARNYDHHLLLSDWIWIGGPMFMAFFSSVFVFAMVESLCKIPSPEGWWSFQNYLAWLRCFLLTAPLAWLYGIPYESFQPILQATILNFCTLLIVSVWRVFLMVRVTQLLFDIKASRAFFAVLVPASLEMGVATFFKQIEIVGIMGGMRLSPHDEFLVAATGAVSGISWVLFFVSLIVAASLRFSQPTAAKAFQEPVVRTPSKALWIVTAAAILFWLLPSFYFQPLLQRKNEFISHLQRKEIEAAVALLQKSQPEDFPPGHDIFAGRTHHQTFKLLALLAHEKELPTWASERLVEDLKNLFEHDAPYLREDSEWLPLIEEYKLDKSSL